MKIYFAFIYKSSVETTHLTLGISVKKVRFINLLI